ncbi:MAG: Sec-independent protein translocase protein TatB [Myxococcales bacterium]|nr:Sec-independent protein translocase protein TatB [Myxococcales bacterium]
MLSFGLGEMLLVAVVALLVVGPERLPRVLRQLGRWYGQARRAADELRRAFVLEADRQDASDRYRKLQERRRQAEQSRQEADREGPAADGDAAEGTDVGGEEAAKAALADAGVPVPQEVPLPVPEGPELPDAPDANAEPPDAPHPTRPTPVVEESP